MRLLPLFLLFCTLAACTVGSSTTQRPALTKPAIEPDGAFWDAAVVAREGDSQAFLYLLSPRMVYHALFPDDELRAVTSQEEFDKQRADIDEKLKPYGKVVQRFAARYMAELRDILKDRFIEVSKPTYNIKYKGDYDRATGPNTARVIVKIYPKKALPEGFQPETMEVRFIQDGRRWLINGLSNDKLKGAFVR